MFLRRQSLNYRLLKEKVSKETFYVILKDYSLILLLLGQQRQMELLDTYNTISQKQPF